MITYMYFQSGDLSTNNLFLVYNDEINNNDNKWIYLILLSIFN